MTYFLCVALVRFNLICRRSAICYSNLYTQPCSVSVPQCAAWITLDFQGYQVCLPMYLIRLTLA